MHKIGIIGCGNMGRAIYERLKDDYTVSVFDKDASKLSNVNIADSTIDLLNKSVVVILAVKPQDFENLLNEIKSNIKDKLVISIAAGITTGYIEKFLGDVKIIRVMPNMPAKIGKGMSCLCKGQNAKEQDLNFAKELFDKLGKTLIFNEDMMDAATAISGSGPGYLYDMIENKSKDDIEKSVGKFISSLAEAAKSIGFSPQQAKLLAKTTVDGSVAVFQSGNVAASELKKQITSKGGTTEAGLKVLHSGGSLKEAVKAALNRGKELSRR